MHPAALAPALATSGQLNCRQGGRYLPPCQPSTTASTERRSCRQRRYRLTPRAADQDLDWEPDLRRSEPLRAPSKSGYVPPPPPPPPGSSSPVAWWEVPFTSRRNIALTMIAGSTGLWLLNNKTGPIQFADKPNIPFKLLGFTDLNENDFVYFKTAGGNWVAAAEDEAGRLFMIDEIGDLYYDSGDPEIGLYAMDTQGNLYNFYNDFGGERKITPVGNISELTAFKISELAGVKLDREISVVGFKDGRQVPLPPGTGYVDESGRFVPPGELVEGFTRTREQPGNLLTDILRGRPDPSLMPPERFELDLNDPTPFQRQMYDQVLLEDPETGYPYLPDDFSFEELEEEVRQEQQGKKAQPLFGKPAMKR